MSTPFFLIEDIDGLVPEIPADSIVSRTVYNGDDVKIVLFGFAAGQELSEHTAARPALLHFLRGEAGLTLGDVTTAARAGTLVRMAPRLSHSVHADTEVVMLLCLLGSGKEQDG